MATGKADLLQGTLAMMILKSLAAQDLHGYSIARWIEGTTKASLAIGEGSLYPTLRRLEDKQLVKSAWKLSETGRRVRVYSITRTGQAYLKNEASSWLEFTRAVTLVLQAEPSLA